MGGWGAWVLGGFGFGLGFCVSWLLAFWFGVLVCGDCWGLGFWFVFLQILLWVLCCWWVLGGFGWFTGDFGWGGLSGLCVVPLGFGWLS